jgi:hypothetical protein
VVLFKIPTEQDFVAVSWHERLATTYFSSYSSSDCIYTTFIEKLHTVGELSQRYAPSRNCFKGFLQPLHLINLFL